MDATAIACIHCSLGQNKYIMEFESLRAYLLKKKGAYEDFPFGPEVMVSKVNGKMFALVFLEDSPLSMNLKCDPDLSMHLRGFYNAVQPGYHMNKRHWNTIILDDSIPDDEIYALIDDSYELVVKGLKKADKLKLEKLSDD
jgi:predicted DNA-binding protein (MmcQ/YjbR family)